MKFQIFIILIAFANGLISKEVLPLRFSNYQIISDEPCTDVPPNRCRIRGVVTYNNHPVTGGKIATYPETVSTITDSLGQFGLMATEIDSIIYFYHENYAEIVLNPYLFRGGHEVVIALYAEPPFLYPNEDKPVIYLYSKSKKKVNVELQLRGEMTFSYPEYNQAWEVEVKNNEIYHPATESNYPYLFWEGKDPHLDFVRNENRLFGFVLKTDTIVSFLEDKLAFLGLNYRERTDFITYWVPRIKTNKYVLLQFLVDEDYERIIAGIKIDPNPDAIRRIFMLWKGFEWRPTIEVYPQELKTFERFGFTVVEWGGSEL